MEKVCFNIPLGDLVTGDQTGPFLNPIPMEDMPKTFGYDWWVEKDRNGIPALCTYAPFGVDTFIDCTDPQGNNAYTSKANSFIGGRPKER